LIHELVDALEDLRRSAKDLEKIALRSLKEVEKGSDLATALSVAQPAETRQTMNDALARVEEIRHRIRLLVFAQGKEQGMTSGELGRRYGFSRQLASRYAKEAGEL
jgi:hypothetical protein